MTNESEHEIEIQRLTVAKAVDLLRDYEQELENARAEGEYTDEVESTYKLLQEKLDSE